MNVALYGGKFDPPHIGHKNLVNQALKLPFIDQLWVIPVKDHPWKKLYATGEQRMEMLKKWESDRVKISDIELRRNKPTITIDTIRELKALYPDYNFYWLCGSDTIPTFHLWDEYKELLKLMTFLVYPRPGFEIKRLPRGFKWLTKRDDITFDISSTRVRDHLKDANFLEKSVIKYISGNNLYVS